MHRLIPCTELQQLPAQVDCRGDWRQWTASRQPSSASPAAHSSLRRNRTCTSRFRQIPLPLYIHSFQCRVGTSTASFLGRKGTISAGKRTTSLRTHCTTATSPPLRVPGRMYHRFLRVTCCHSVLIFSILGCETNSCTYVPLLIAGRCFCGSPQKAEATGLGMYCYGRLTNCTADVQLSSKESKRRPIRTLVSQYAADGGVAVNNQQPRDEVVVAAERNMWNDVLLPTQSNIISLPMYCCQLKVI